MRVIVMMLAMGLFPGAAAKSAAQPIQVKNSFEFMVHAPMREVAPLFGPEGERCWAGKGWNPAFVWPQPAKDVPGAVFMVQHNRHTSVWVNTIFDQAAGRMQYVAILPEVMVFSVDVRLTAVSASLTRADVTYTRTALDAALNDDVIAMGKRDRESGPHWKKNIEAALKSGVAGRCTAEK